MIQDELYYQFYGKDIPQIIYDFAQPIFNTFKSWKENGGVTHIQVTYDEIVQPLYNLIISTAPSQYSASITNSCLKCMNAIANFKVIEDLLKDEVRVGIKVNTSAFEKGRIILNAWK